VVLSGGGITAALMELGFLRRLKETALWPRIGSVFGTSAGALIGFMAVLDRLDELERFLLSLRPEDAFRAQALWRLPLLGFHDYALPRTVCERLGDPGSLARALAASEQELVVFATDVTDGGSTCDGRPCELAFSSRSTAPEEMVDAVFASAAISALVLPRRVGDRVATDGGWVRHFPLGAAYERPEVETIVAFRFLPSFPHFGTAALGSLRARLERLPPLPPVKALVRELRAAERRALRGEPAHLAEMLASLARVSVLHNTALEDIAVLERDASLRELTALRSDLVEIVRRTVADADVRERAVREVEERFGAARFPFGRQRPATAIVVRATAGELALRHGLRRQDAWPETEKRALIARGYELADRELARSGIVTARAA
jgi:predicted acylesterase/phospholipase RssA